ncbi:MAG: prolyl oligopeptidase family serine peptidase, partial [Alphaproteobacteria bacterium]
MSAIDSRPTVDAPDDDPYIWLEDIDSEASLAWVETQNARTLARYAGSQFATDRDALTAIFDRPDNIPYVTRRGGLIYNFWRDAEHPRGLWRRTTLASFSTDAPDWDVLLDLDALAAAEGEDWVWGGASTLPPAHERAILRLSRGGSDACVLREFDLINKRFVKDGFILPEAKGFAGWLDADTALLSSVYGGENFATSSGYPRTVRLWRRGTDAAAAPVLFEADASVVSAGGYVDRTAAAERIWFYERPSFFDSIHWIGDRNGPQRQLDLPRDTWVDFHGDWAILKTRSSWAVAGTTYAPDTLLGPALSDILAGMPKPVVLFEGRDRIALQDFFWSGEELVLSILDNLKPRYEALTPSPSASGWERRRLEGLPETGVVSAWRFDMEEQESNGDILVNAQDPITPPTLSLRSVSAASMVLKRAPAVFDTAGLVVAQHEAVSVDGERIPYTQVGPATHTGDAPVLMTGYGGFAVTKQALYNSAIGKLWLERGGTAVVTNIRGGGEFGTRWHDAGRREGKRLSHDDFAAIAADLVARGVTRPERIAAEGGSNGGILITNMMTRYPECFGALFCTIPLIDMRRYTRLHAGASWIDEYGDPDKPEDWAFIKTYSAYHAAEPGKRYPPILLATSRRDDRVHPGHARKMAAKLQAMGYEAFFSEPAAGGNGYGKDN